MINLVPKPITKFENQTTPQSLSKRHTFLLVGALVIAFIIFGLVMWNEVVIHEDSYQYKTTTEIKCENPDYAKLHVKCERY